MQSLRDEVIRLRCENIHGEEFVPHLALDSIMTVENVRCALKESNLDAHDRPAVEESILSGNFRIAAILLSIGYMEKMVDFVRSDQFQDPQSHIDHRLPLEMETLKDILVKSPNRETISKLFYKEQWMYTAPVLPRNVLPRCLDKRTILPIMDQKLISDGGYGEVYETTFHEKHRKFGEGQEWKCVRKEFKATIDEREALKNYEIELRNLSIIGQIKHPCIIELLGAFTYHGKHSLIFPQMSGTLEELFMDQKPALFKEDSAFLIALSLLSSAVAELHNFSSYFIGLNMIGCHHDLKPSNILVDKEKFILADFGLSYFKKMSQDSKSMYRKGEANYLAPECEDLTHPDFPKGKAGRKRDIWAFGCVILETLIYIGHGSQALKDFREKREWDTQEWTLATFHCGNRPHPVVEAELRKMEDLGEVSRKILVNLIRKMFDLVPEERPNASQVTLVLRLATIHELLRPIENTWSILMSQHWYSDEKIIISIEEARYRCWKEVNGLQTMDETHSTHHFESNFKITVAALKQFQVALEDCEELLPNTLDGRIFIPLRHANNHLVEILPPTEYQNYQSLIIQRTVTDCRDPAYLQKVCDGFKESSSPYIGGLAGVKLMSELSEEAWKTSTNGPSLRIGINQVKIGPKKGLLNLGTLEPTVAQHIPQHIIIEWLHYGARVASISVGTERAKRVELVATRLHSIDELTGLKALHCSNFFVDEPNCRFGLVFDFPASLGVGKKTRLDEIQILTLAELLKRKEQAERPSLGDRFKLAHALVKSVSEFHRVGWLHKNLSPHNVVFLRQANETVAQVFANPYLVGFSHSRPDSEGAFTEGPAEGDRNYQDYQHPEYLKSRERYRMEYDYYSLGIILLEITHWKLLSTLTSSPEWQTLSPETFRKGLIKEARALRLQHSMGTRHCKAMVACITGEFGVVESDSTVNDSTEGRAMLHSKFQQLVAYPKLYGFCA